MMLEQIVGAARLPCSSAPAWRWHRKVGTGTSPSAGGGNCPSSGLSPPLATKWARSIGDDPRAGRRMGEVPKQAALPRTVVIFAPADVHAFEIASVMDVFNEANAQAAHATLYTLTFVAERHDVIRCASGLRIVPDRSIHGPSPDADTIIVAGSYGVPGTPSDAVIEWIRQRSQSARRYGSVCTGAFFGRGGRSDRRAPRHDALALRGGIEEAVSHRACGS